MAFTLLAALNVNRSPFPRKLCVLFILTAVGLVMALGDNGLVYSWVRKLMPQIGFMRFPVKFLALATFAFPLIAASAVASSFDAPLATGEVRWRKIFFVWLLLTATIGLLAWSASQSPCLLGDPTVPFDVPGTLRNALIRAIFVTAILGFFLLLGKVTASRWQLVLALGIVLLVWGDLATHYPHLSPTVAVERFQPDAIREYMKWTSKISPGESRVMVTPSAWIAMQHRVYGKQEVNLTSHRVVLFQNLNLLDHVPKVDGFFTLSPYEAEALNVHLYTMTNGLEPLKDFMGVSQISHPTNALEWCARDSYMPLMTVGQEPIFVDDLAAFKGVIGDDFIPQRRVFLPQKARNLITASNNLDARIVDRHFSPELLSAEVETRSPTMFVVAQTFYHNWYATVDGRPTQLWRADYAFQALEVPAGRHQVQLVYKDVSFQRGLVVSLVTLMVCLVLLWRTGRRCNEEAP